MENTNQLQNLQLHYYLSNDSHSMNAKVLNKAESELLKIANEISILLDIDIYIETQALEEGGVKSIYKFVTKKKNLAKIAYVGVFFAGIMSTVLSDVIADAIKTDPEMEKLKKQKIELEIKKLKQDIENDSIENAQHHVQNNSNIIVVNVNGEEIIIDEELIDNISLYLAENNKIKIAKSNFYESLLQEGKVDKLSTQVLDQDLRPTSLEKFVPRSDFNRFIISTNEVEPQYYEGVELEVVSPVLKRSRLNWKALFNSESITFKLKDEDFQNMVINKNLGFSNGTRIICDLEIKMKMNNEGELLESGKSVYNVSQIIYPDGDIVDVIHE